MTKWCFFSQSGWKQMKLGKQGKFISFVQERFVPQPKSTKVHHSTIPPQDGIRVSGNSSKSQWDGAPPSQGAHLPPGRGDDPSEGFQDHPPRGSGSDDCGWGAGAQGSDAGEFELIAFFCTYFETKLWLIIGSYFHAVTGVCAPRHGKSHLLNILRNLLILKHQFWDPK